MAEVTEMKSAAELNQQSAPAFVPSQEGVPPPMDDNAVRAIFEKASQNGVDDLNTPIQTAPMGQPPIVEPARNAVDVPAKFLKPDGTADEDKLNASSKQLDAAIEQKQKSVEEMVAEYKAKEKQLHDVGAQKAQVQQQLQQMPTVPNRMPQAPLQDPNAEALRQQILRDYQNNPIDTIIEIAKVIAAKQVEPIAQVAAVMKEQETDTTRRTLLTEIAQKDPRILQHGDLINKIMFEEEPEMLKLKNPYKAAWNEAKGRLRLGEPSPVQAQPSIPSPMLGRGSPASTFGMPAPASPQTLGQAIGQTDMQDKAQVARVEEELKRITNGMWQQ